MCHVNTLHPHKINDADAGVRNNSWRYYIPLSLFKKVRDLIFFDGMLADETSKNKLVWFVDTAQPKKLRHHQQKKTPDDFINCEIKQSRCGEGLKLLLKSEVESNKRGKCMHTCRAFKDSLRSLEIQLQPCICGYKGGITVDVLQGMKRGFLGMCDTSQTPALGVMTIVPDRTAATLLPILQCHLRDGTTEHSDQWAAYNRVQQLQPVSIDNAVNHSLNLVDPATEGHLCVFRKSLCAGSLHPNNDPRHSSRVHALTAYRQEKAERRWLKRQETVAMHAASLRNQLTHVRIDETHRRPLKTPPRQSYQPNSTRTKKLCSCFIAESAGHGYLHSCEDDQASKTQSARRMAAPR